MKKKIILFNFLIIVIALAALFAFGVSASRESHFNEAEKKIDEITRIYVNNYSEEIKNNLKENTPKDIRVTIIAADGTVIADSETDDVSTLENHSGREEIIAAYKGEPKKVRRHSDTLGKDMVYFALKTAEDESGNFVYVRVAVPVESVNGYVAQTAATGVYVLLAAIAVSLVLGYVAANSLVKPLNEVKSSLEAVNAGTFKEISRSSGDPEINGILSEINGLNEKLQKSIKETSDEKERLDYILSNVSDGIIVLGRDGNVVIANKNASAAFGITELCGRSFTVLTENEKFNAAIKNAVCNRTDDIFEFCPSDGKTYMVSVKNLEKGFVAIVLSDVTAIKNAEKTRSEFFDNAGHELKTPLTAVKGFNDMIALSSSDEKIKGYSQKIDKELSRVIVLINEMLALSKLETQKTAEPAEPLNLVKTAEEVAETLSPIAQNAGVKISVSGKGSYPITKEHAVELIKNLAENGVRYNEKGGFVKIKIDETANKVILTVTDNGIGIEHEHLPRVFERFYRVNKSRSRETGGTGLGLSIVKHVCSLYGAEPVIQSEYGTGTMVTVTFYKNKIETNAQNSEADVRDKNADGENSASGEKSVADDNQAEPCGNSENASKNVKQFTEADVRAADVLQNNRK